MKLHHQLLFLLFSFLFSGVVFAKSQPSVGHISGYVDTSYNYLVRSNHFVSGTLNRYNDVAKNGISLQQFSVKFENTPDQGIGELLHIIIGRDANVLAPKGLNPDMFGIQNIGITVPGAYVQYQQKLTTFIIGEMQSLAGYETLEYPQTPFFSDSILYGYAEPGTHLGARLTQILNEQFSINLGINNGWNTIERAGQQNTLEFAVNYHPTKAFSFTADAYTGQQHHLLRSSVGPTSRLNFFDIYGTWHATSKLSFSLNLDRAVLAKALLPNQQIAQAIWKGAAGYISYQISEKWVTNLRGEVFDDSNGYRSGIRQNWREATLSLAYHPFKNWQIRGETRHDFSNVNSFKNKSGNGTNANQQSYAADLLYLF